MKSHFAHLAIILACTKTVESIKGRPVRYLSKNDQAIPNLRRGQQTDRRLSSKKSKKSSSAESVDWRIDASEAEYTLNIGTEDVTSTKKAKNSPDLRIDPSEPEYTLIIDPDALNGEQNSVVEPEDDVSEGAGNDEVDDTEESGTPVEDTNESDPTDFLDFDPPFLQDGSNTTSSILVKMTDGISSCISYNPSDPTSNVEVTDCDEAAQLANWEVVESEESQLFLLRHVESQLCLPENPEFPDRAFNCWINEVNQAVADTINGLVDCASPFAAFVGFLDPANPSYLYNALCSTGEVGDDSDVVLMAYTLNNATQLLWGEKLLLDLPLADSPFVLSGTWFFEESAN